MSDLIEKLREDLDAAKRELEQMDDRRRMLEWRVQYIETILESSRDDTPITKMPEAVARHLKAVLRKEMTIADAAMEILGSHGKPMSAMEISRAAIESGYPDPGANIERVRSHFSAVISKDIRSSEKPRFWQVGRGQIGLNSWRSAEISIGDDPIDIFESPNLEDDVDLIAELSTVEPVLPAEKKQPPKVI